ISGYIFSNFLPSRINQLISLADRKFTDYYSCVATENELPTLEFISSDLLEKTILIRNPEVNSEKVLFIVGKPGVGKSHLVNELKVPETQLYRFWIRNQDPERIDRLNYNTFLNQLSLKLFGSGRLRTEEEIISKFDSNGEVFYIDGLDHVENYNPIQIQYYFDFIDKINKTKSGRVVVLTRPLNQKIEYPIYQLQNWSPEETKEYLKQKGIEDYSLFTKIYEISHGYPIIASFVTSEWFKNGRLAHDGKISELTEYYSIVINNIKFKSKLSIFTLSSTFFMKDELEFLLDDKKNELFDFIDYYPYLFEIRDERIALIHDSFNNYITNQIQLDLSLKQKLHEFV
ncbi:MAG: hypothetical protein M0R05_06100, partial [Bacilli bacterium]|nr:hypothetical protein [Bacilli bacterium]